MATASSTATPWPTYIDPNNGALVSISPTPTYTPYMDPNNGAIYSGSYYQSGNYAGSVSSQTVAVGDAYSVVVSDNNGNGNGNAPYSSVPPSGFSDWDSYGQYTAGLANDNATMTDGGDGQDSSPSPTTSTSTETGSNAGSPIKIVTAAVPGVVGLAVIILGIWLCCRCKKRRRAKRTISGEQGGQEGGGEGRYGQMEEMERGVPVSVTSRYQAPSLTRAEVLGVVSPRTQQHQQQQQQRHQNQHRIDLVYPSRPPAAASADEYRQLASPAGTFGGHQFPRRGPASHVGSSSRHSRWTDDSEFDVMAEDGSTITRTISTTSTRRTVGGGDGDSVITTIDENPFDHPAYTYRAAPQPQRSGTLSRNNTLTRVTPVGTWSSSQQPSLAYGSTLSPISPVTPMSTSFPSSPAPSYIQPQHQHQIQETRRNESDTYSIHSSEDGIFGNSASIPGSIPGSGSGSASTSAMDRLSAPTRPGIRRDPTIIRHADSSAQGLGRYSTKIERAGRDDAGIVELPPLYEDATSSWTR